VRLRLTNGVLSFACARRIAELSRRFGNGLIDLSARGNMQLRGVGETALEPLWNELGAMGLLDADADAEAVRNVIPSPLAGFDASAILDARPIVAALEARLTGEAALRGLPSKFGFVVDGGGALPLSGLDADVRFEGYAASERVRLRVRLGDVAVGAVAPERAADAASAIGRAFLALRAEERRMSALIARVGPAAMTRQAGLEAASDVGPAARRVSPADVIGVHALGAKAYVGAAVCFGRLNASELACLAGRAEARGAAELRLTPWRAVLAVGLEVNAAHLLAGDLPAFGFLLDASDPRLVIAACPGTPACVSAHADVRALALRLSPLFVGHQGRVHVSGCAKGCAHNAKAPVTIVAAREGYDVVVHGLARDAPTVRGLDVAALETYVRSRLGGARV